MNSFDITGFSSVFNYSQGQEKMPFNCFRSDPAFHFLRPVGDQVYDIDSEALQISNSINEKLTTSYLQVKKPTLGYENIPYFPLDKLDCRHIMMSTILFNYVKAPKIITEIGGGFGNWARLNIENSHIQQWNIIDLPFVQALQKWYLSDCAKEHYYKINFLTLDSVVKSDVIIASHSLSELSWRDFMSYMPLLNETQYLFYARHKDYPNPELSEIKLDVLKLKFRIIEQIKSENGNVDNIIFEKS